MSWLNNFYRRRKNPRIGFALVFIFGPFGFLYHSWQTALGVFFVAGPLWIVFLRHTRFDLIENPWAHYIALFLLAAFASLQIKIRHRELDRLAVKLAQGTEIIRAALSLLSNATEQEAFSKYLREHPVLSAKLQMNETILYRPEDPLTRWEIASLLTSYGTMQGDAGDLSGTTSSLLYSIMFFEDNPIAWAGMAQVYVMQEDKIAIRWTQKVLNFSPQSTSEIINKTYSDISVLSTLQDMKERTQLIIKVCSEHPEWRDSYSLYKARYEDI